MSHAADFTGLGWFEFDVDSFFNTRAKCTDVPIKLAVAFLRWCRRGANELGSFGDLVINLNVVHHNSTYIAKHDLEVRWFTDLNFLGR